jgi:hypothetical protein
MNAGAHIAESNLRKDRRAIDEADHIEDAGAKF